MAKAQTEARIMLADAARRRFDMVLVRDFDRFGRSGLTTTVVDLQRLKAHGVSFRRHAEERIC
jgi:DNA invertase Pin-like site-specific DNA recombinase